MFIFEVIPLLQNAWQLAISAFALGAYLLVRDEDEWNEISDVCLLSECVIGILGLLLKFFTGAG